MDGTRNGEFAEIMGEAWDSWGWLSDKQQLLLHRSNERYVLVSAAVVCDTNLRRCRRIIRGVGRLRCTCMQGSLSHVVGREYDSRE